MMVLAFILLAVSVWLYIAKPMAAKIKSGELSFIAKLRQSNADLNNKLNKDSKEIIELKMSLVEQERAYERRIEKIRQRYMNKIESLKQGTNDRAGDDEGT